MDNIELLKLANVATRDLLHYLSMRQSGHRASGLEEKHKCWLEAVSDVRKKLDSDEISVLLIIYKELERFADYLPSHIPTEYLEERFDPTPALRDAYKALEITNGFKIARLLKEARDAHKKAIEHLQKLTYRQELIVDFCEGSAKTIQQIMIEMDIQDQSSSRGTVQAEVSHLKGIGRLDQVSRKGGYISKKRLEQ